MWRSQPEMETAYEVCEAVHLVLVPPDTAVVARAKDAFLEDIGDGGVAEALCCIGLR